MESIFIAANTDSRSSSSFHPKYSAICCERVYGPCDIPAPPHEDEDFFPESITPQYRLNLLVTDGSGDMLYFGYSQTHVARYRIRRCKGVFLEPLPSATINPPTVINNMRVAHFPPHRGGSMLLMTGGSELTNEHGTLSVMPLPNLLRNSRTTRTTSPRRTRRKRKAPRTTRYGENSRREKRIESVNMKAHTFMLPVRSAWGLAVHNDSCRIAVSSNSRAILILGVTTSNAFVNVAGDTSAEEPPGTANVAGPVNLGGAVNATGPANAATVGVQLGGGNINTGNDGVESVENANERGEQSDSCSDSEEERERARFEGEFERRFRLVPISDRLDGTHRDNIPCTAFNASGDRLASGSIDTTFALYDLSDSSEPFDMIMDLFVPRVSGQRLFQSDTPVRSANYNVNIAQRVWAVHWTSRHCIPVIHMSQVKAREYGRKHSEAFRRCKEQHKYGIWIPDETCRTNEPDNTDNLLDTVFYPEPERPASNLSGDPIVLYNDDTLENFHKFGGGAEVVGSEEDVRDSEAPAERPQAEKDSTDEHKYANEDEAPSYGFIFIPETGRSAAGRKRRRSEKRDDELILVGREEMISLYSIQGGRGGEDGRVDDESGRKRDTNREGNIDEDVEEEKTIAVLLDQLRIRPVFERVIQPQKLFTNVIEIKALRAFIVTAVSTGVFLLRIVHVDPNDEETSDDNTEKQGIGKNLNGTRLFVERIFPSRENVIGTCVVERPAPCRNLRSFELWMLEQDGTVQCWDLSEHQTGIAPLDIF